MFAIAKKDGKHEVLLFADLLLLGCGEKMLPPPGKIQKWLASQGVALECLSTVSLCSAFITDLLNDGHSCIKQSPLVIKKPHSRMAGSIQGCQDPYKDVLVSSTMLTPLCSVGQCCFHIQHSESGRTGGCRSIFAQ